MTCAIFIAGFGLFKKISFPVNLLAIFFILAYAINSLSNNFGPTQIFFLQKNFQFAAKIIYFVLGVVSFVLGVMFFKDWILINRGLLSAEANDKKEVKLLPKGRLMAYVSMPVLAGFLSALSTYWPLNSYILLLGNEGLIKGQWQSVAPLTITYVLVSMWPLWFIWVFLNIKNLRPSLLKIFSAAIYFIASSSMIFIFK